MVACLIVGLAYYYLYLDPPPEPSDTTLLNGMRVRQWHKLETDILYKEIFEDHTYGELKSEDGKVAMPLRFEPGMLIVDVGGNIGFFSLYAWDRCKGDATIHTFEPMPAIYGVLEENCRRANAGDLGPGGAEPPAGLHCHRVACSSSEGEVEFEFHPYMSIWSTLDPSFDKWRLESMLEDAPLIVDENLPLLAPLLKPILVFALRAWANALGRSTKVMARTARLSDELERAGVGASSGRRIGVLKVDVEGAELDVLRGLDDEDWDRVDQVAMEVESEENRTKACSILESHGLRPAFAPAFKLKGKDTSRVWNIFAVRD